MSEVRGGQLVARQLRRAGIDTVFVVFAGPMTDVAVAMYEEGIKVVGCRHEESAAFAAAAWGYVKKKPGVVVAGSGPGMINTVTGMYVATESAMPLVVLGGSFHGHISGLGGFQEADQVAYAQPACKWTVQVQHTAQIPELIYLALGKAVSGRPGAVYVDFPAHITAGTVEEGSERYRDAPREMSLPQPDARSVESIASMLAEAERPLVLIGKGAAWSDAPASLTELVSRGIPYVGSPMGRGVIPDDNEMCMNAARSAALLGADAVLMLGGRFNWVFQFGRPPRFAEDVRIAHVDLIAEEMYSSADVEIGVVADVAATVRMLNDALRGRELRSASTGWVDQLRGGAQRNEAKILEQMNSDAEPINHYRLVRDLRDALPRDAAVSVDGELTMGVARAVLPAYNPRLVLTSGTTGCMGVGVPYAIGAKLAMPEVPSVALVGDYAFGAAMPEVETAARVGANVVFVVSNNAGISGHGLQDRMFPPDAPPIAALMPANYEKVGEMVGGFARRVDRPADIVPAIKDALAANTVGVINVMTDPKGTREGSFYLG